MNTPAHLIFGAYAFSRPERRGTLAAALAGSAMPDLSLYLMVTVSIWVLNVPPQTVFGELYYSDAWQAVFAVDNSFVLWGLLLGFAIWRAWPRLTAFAGAGFLHLCFDFPLHTHDARMHFWPVTDWVFESPVSYWDNAAHAGVVGPMTLAMSFALAGILIRRYRNTGLRTLFAGLALAELASSGIWRFLF